MGANNNIRHLHTIIVAGHRLATYQVFDPVHKTWSDEQCHFTVGNQVYGVVLKSSLELLQRSLENGVEHHAVSNGVTDIVYDTIEQEGADPYTQVQVYEHNVPRAVMPEGAAKLFVQLLKPLKADDVE